MSETYACTTPFKPIYAQVRFPCEVSGLLSWHEQSYQNPPSQDFFQMTPSDTRCPVTPSPRYPVTPLPRYPVGVLVTDRTRIAQWVEHFSVSIMITSSWSYQAQTVTRTNPSSYTFLEQVSVIQGPLNRVAMIIDK